MSGEIVTEEMVTLTNGIFGSASGLISTIIDGVLWLIGGIPWCDLGAGLGQLMDGLFGPPAC